MIPFVTSSFEASAVLDGLLNHQAWMAIAPLMQLSTTGSLEFSPLPWLWMATSGMVAFGIGVLVTLRYTKRWLGASYNRSVSQLEGALRQSQEQLRLAIDLTRVGCWSMDASTGKSIWNDNHYHLMGLAPQTVASGYDTWRDRVHPDDLASVEQSFQQALEQNQDLEAEHRIVYPDGQVRWVLTRGRGIYDQAGRLLRVVGIMLDISDRKQAEEALRQHDQEFKALVEHAPDVIARIDRHLRFSYVNPSIESTTGIPADQWLGKPLSALGLPESLVNSCQQAMQSVLHSGQEQVYEAVLPTSNGNCNYCACRLVPEFSQAGTVDTILLLGRDVTERKRLELALKASEAKLNNILNSAIASIVSFRLYTPDQWEYEYRSAGCISLSGYSLDELASDRFLWFSRIHPEDLETIVRPLHHRLFTETGLTAEYRFFHQDGSIRWISSTYTSDAGADGSYRLVTVVDVDITARKQAEEALRQSEERFQEIVQIIDQIFFIRAITGEILYISPAYERIWGRSREELYRDSTVWQAAIHPDDRDQIQRSIIHQFAGNSVTREYRIIRPDGAIRWIFAQITLVHDADGQPRHFIGFAADITDRKLMEERLQASLHEKTILLSEIHHRVKNNLQLISSLLDLQVMRIDNPQVKLMLEDSQHRIQAMAGVHEQLYRSCNFAGVNFGDYARDLACSLLCAHRDDSRIQLHLDVEPDLLIHLDQSIPCGLILNELITNALKYGYTNGRGGILSIGLHLLSHNLIELTVGNDGDTLPQEFDLQSIFHSMGLNLVLLLAEQMGGKLHYERGDRTLFKLIFPHQVQK